LALVLVVDDVAAMAEQYAYDLHRMGGFETLVALGGGEALDVVVSEPVDCMILDLEMPGVDGFEVLRRLKKKGVGVPVIVYTGTGDFARCVKAVKMGASDFIDKSEPMERVVHAVDNALERAALEAEVTALRRDLGEDTPLLGSSREMKRLKESVVRVAAIPSPVLIVGESGTGKELVARELHRLGKHPGKPFVAVNSAALPENLVESELFGHERGAFTGADRARRGAFELAAGGTLFLDEIGELPSPAQAKLLRVLEDLRVTRVGGERAVEVDARVVAATNRDLEVEVAEGRFREDLYYRLNVHIVRVPPLRDRRSDVPGLIDHFLASTCGRFGIRTKRIEPEAKEALAGCEWRRNNVRELRNIIERLVIAAEGDVIGVEHIPGEIRDGGADDRAARPRSFQEQKAEAERRIIVAALDRNDWHITRTAQDLGLADHSSLLKIMRRHHLKRP
jgi:DNA-binding NtrC family response regulator